MLRYIQQGIQKALRNHPARAPCQKASQDSDELDSSKNLGYQRRCVSSYAQTPLSQPLPEYDSDVPPPSDNFSPHELFGFGQKQTNHNQQQCNRGSNGWSLNTDLVKGAVVGTGFAVFHSLHGFCSGRKSGSSSHAASSRSSKFCPMSQYYKLHRSNALFHTLSHLLPGSYDVTPGFSILPRQHQKTKVSRQQAAATTNKSSKVGEDAALGEDSTGEIIRKEYQNAKTKVDSFLDSLCRTDSDFYAADHMRALQAWADKNHSAAVELWQRTYDKIGTPLAANRLGYCYEHGKSGVSQDYEQAARYYKIAVEHGCAKAMYNLAMLQVRGLVTETVDSYELLTKSASLDCPQALTYLGSQHFAQGRKSTAFKYYERAAKHNDADACFYLGICYENGFGTLRNDERALDQYMHAAEQGHAQAQYNLAVFYEEGLGGLTADRDRAVYWYGEAAAGGVQLAKERLHQIGETTHGMKSSVSLPAFGRYLAHTVSDLSPSDLIRSRSENMLKLDTISESAFMPHNSREKTVTPSSSCSSLSTYGAAKFFLPAATESHDDDIASQSSVDWSTDKDSSQSYDSTEFDLLQDELALPKLTYNQSFGKLNHYSFNSCSQSSLHKPEHESPQILFA